MNVIKIARVPATTVGPDETVIEGIRAMQKATVGAVLVVDGGQPLGIFSERDVMLRVVSENKDPKTTTMSEVMTGPVLTIHKNTSTDDALKIMGERHIRHLPVVNDAGQVEGMLSIRHLLLDKVEHLTQELDSLEAYLTVDGIGG